MAEWLQIIDLVAADQLICFFCSSIAVKKIILRKQLFLK
jgi:hypothetical protein